jgi:hypothetical protein
MSTSDFFATVANSSLARSAVFGEPIRVSRRYCTLDPWTQAQHAAAWLGKVSGVALDADQVFSPAYVAHNELDDSKKPPAGCTIKTSLDDWSNTLNVTLETGGKKFSWPESDDVPSNIPSVQPVDPAWPTLDDAALYGIAGDVVDLLEPHTEADPVALLVSFLAEAGAMLNRGPHVILDGTYHPLLFWPVLVGRSSKSRKGTADKRMRQLFGLTDPIWTRGECKGTLSSGEGLVFAVRDDSYAEHPVKEKGKFTGETVRVRVDSGVTDKRLFLVQPEFGSVLRIMAREGNSLSGVLRDAWDGLTLAPMTKANRVRATDPHIGIVGHVTKDELLRNLTNTEASNGFGNRFAWFAVQRSKELPFSSAPDESHMNHLAARLSRAIKEARSISRVGLTDMARSLWAARYHELSADRPGLAGSLLGRAEAQVMRLAALYAVLDGHNAINSAHLNAAFALWQYAEDSTKLIFGNSLGDPVADTILNAIRTNGELTDSQLSELFGRNMSAAKLARAKNVLLTAGLAHCATEESGGRPRMVWKAGTKKTN